MVLLHSSFCVELFVFHFMIPFVRDAFSIFTFPHFPVVLEKLAEFVEKFIGSFWFCVLGLFC